MAMIAPGAMGRQHARRDHQLLDGVLRRFLVGEVPEERGAAKVRERAPDVGLKQDDDGEDEVAEDVPHQPVEGIEPAPSRTIEDDDEQERARRHLHGARSFDELEDHVDEHRHHEDVGKVPQADGGAPKKGRDRIHALRIASAVRTTWTISATACTRTMCAPFSTAAVTAAAVGQSRPAA